MSALYRIVDADDPGTHDLFVIDQHGRDGQFVAELIEKSVREVKQEDPDEYTTESLTDALEEYDLILIEPMTVNEPVVRQ